MSNSPNAPPRASDVAGGDWLQRPLLETLKHIHLVPNKNSLGLEESGLEYCERCELLKHLRYSCQVYGWPCVHFGELHDSADESVLSETEIEGQDVFNTVWLIHGCFAWAAAFPRVFVFQVTTNMIKHAAKIAQSRCHKESKTVYEGG